MKHYGFVPPWTGRDSRYGWWKNVGELWDGGWVWELRPPLNVSERLNELLNHYYAPMIRDQLNSEVLLFELAERSEG